MEISQTFDGNSAPVKKTITNRWEEYLNGEVQIQESTATLYYLRSTALGGKVIAQLDETGYKGLGYVFAGGMQIATQYVWDPGAGFDVAWTTTSPATGSEYMVGGPYLSRQELDPLGADVTEPPQPQLVFEPVFYNPKFDQMPLQIEGGPSDDYQQANADWASLVTATIHAAQERDRAEKLWQSGKRSEAMAILHENPNVGIEYRTLVDGEVVESGSYFGKDAADFLNGLNTALDAGRLSPLVATSAYIGLVGGDSIGGATPTPEDTRTSCQRFVDAVDNINTNNPHLIAEDFVQRLYSRFANLRNEFSSDGFKIEFQDFKGSPDQARHYIGGLKAGFTATQWGSETLGRWVANAREYDFVVTMDTGIPLVYRVQNESQKADHRLNAVSTRHGGALSRGEIRPIHLAGLIRKEVCE